MQPSRMRLASFRAEPFERGNLDAARLNLLFDEKWWLWTRISDPMSYEAMLVIDEKVARQNFPNRLKMSWKFDERWRWALSVGSTAIIIGKPST